MLVRCPSCSAKFNVPDAKIAGKRAKMQCKKCGSVIPIDGTSLALGAPEVRPLDASEVRPTPAPAPVAPAPSSKQILPSDAHRPGPISRPSTPTARRERPITASGISTRWRVSQPSGQLREFSLAEVAARFSKGEFEVGSLVCAPGRDEWLPPSDFPEVVGAADGLAVPPPRDLMPTFSDETVSLGPAESAALARQSLAQASGRNSAPGTFFNENDLDDAMGAFDNLVSVAPSRALHTPLPKVSSAQRRTPSSVPPPKAPARSLSSPPPPQVPPSRPPPARPSAMQVPRSVPPPAPRLPSTAPGLPSTAAVAAHPSAPQRPRSVPPPPRPPSAPPFPSSAPAVRSSSAPAPMTPSAPPFAVASTAPPPAPAPAFSPSVPTGFASAPSPEVSFRAEPAEFISPQLSPSTAPVASTLPGTTASSQPPRTSLRPEKAGRSGAFFSFVLVFFVLVGAVGSLYLFKRPLFDRGANKLREVLGAEPAEAPVIVGPDFDEKAATEILSAASQNASRCKEPNGPTGKGRVQVLFAQTGNPTSVAVSLPFHETTTGQCLVNLFMGTRVPAFGGQSVRVHKTFEVR